MLRDLDEDLRVVHAGIETLSAGDQARRAEVVKLLRAFAHDLEPEERRHVTMIRASFANAGDYVALVGGRRERAWVMGKLAEVDGRLRFRQIGVDQPTFDLALEATAMATAADDLWFGLVVTDRAGYPSGPVVLVEKLESASGFTPSREV